MDGPGRRLSPDTIGELLNFKYSWLLCCSWASKTYSQRSASHEFQTNSAITTKHEAKKTSSAMIQVICRNQKLTHYPPTSSRPLALRLQNLRHLRHLIQPPARHLRTVFSFCRHLNSSLTPTLHAYRREQYQNVMNRFHNHLFHPIYPFQIYTQLKSRTPPPPKKIISAW